MPAIRFLMVAFGPLALMMNFCPKALGDPPNVGASSQAAAGTTQPPAVAPTTPENATDETDEPDPEEWDAGSGSDPVDRVVAFAKALQYFCQREDLLPAEATLCSRFCAEDRAPTGTASTVFPICMLDTRPSVIAAMVIDRLELQRLLDKAASAVLRACEVRKKDASGDKDAVSTYQNVVQPLEDTALHLNTALHSAAPLATLVANTQDWAVKALAGLGKMLVDRAKREAQNWALGRFGEDLCDRESQFSGYLQSVCSVLAGAPSLKGYGDGETVWNALQSAFSTDLKALPGRLVGEAIEGALCASATQKVTGTCAPGFLGGNVAHAITSVLHGESPLVAAHILSVELHKVHSENGQPPAIAPLVCALELPFQLELGYRNAQLGGPLRHTDMIGLAVGAFFRTDKCATYRVIFGKVKPTKIGQKTTGRPLLLAVVKGFASFEKRLEPTATAWWLVRSKTVETGKLLEICKNQSSTRTEPSPKAPAGSKSKEESPNPRAVVSPACVEAAVAAVDAAASYYWLLDEAVQLVGANLTTLFSHKQRVVVDRLSLALKQAIRGEWFDFLFTINALASHIWGCSGPNQDGAARNLISPDGRCASLAKFMKYAGTIASLALAEGPDQMARVMDQLAEPVGTSSAKSHPKRFTVSLNGMVAAGAGLELRWGQYGVQRLSGDPAAPMGLLMPVGVSLSWGREGSISPFQLMFSMIDPAAFIQYDAAGSELPTPGLLTALSPGLAAAFGLKESPFRFGVAAAYRPAFRRATSDPQEPGADALQFLLFFGIDIDLLTLYRGDR